MRDAASRTGRVLAVTCLTGALALPAKAAAAPPPNDDIANATVVSGVPVEASGSLVDSTREPGEPVRYGLSDAQSIWFKWTAPASGGFSVSRYGCTSASTNDAFGATVYTGPAADVQQLTPVETFGYEDQVFGATAGTVYWIAVAPFVGYQPQATACVRLSAAASNDDFANASPLQGYPAEASFAGGVFATFEPGEPDHGFAELARSVWYSWRSPRSGSVVVRLCGQFSVPRIAIYTGDRVDALTRVPVVETAGRPCHNFVVEVAATREYRIAVPLDYWPNGAYPFQLLVGGEAAVVGSETFSYVGLPGRSDHLRVRLVGSGASRALLVTARGVDGAAGCTSQAGSSALVCPISARGKPNLFVELHDGDDVAAIDVPKAAVGIDLGDGDDHGELVERAGAGVVDGGAGDDTITGVSGSQRRPTPTPVYRDDPASADVLYLAGGPGSDRIYGGRGPDALIGGPGADSLAGRAGDDWLYGGAGADAIVAGAGRDTPFGGPGNDRIRADGDSLDVVRCSGGADRVRIDGVDITRSCERRHIRGASGAVALWAVLTEVAHDLDLLISCPVDAAGGCHTQVVITLRRGRRITRDLTVARGRSRILTVSRLSGREKSWMVRHGLPVAVRTRSPAGRATRFAARVGVFDNRYFGE